MQEFRDERGRLVAMTSNAPLNTTVDNQPMETPHPPTWPICGLAHCGGSRQRLR
jgi:hypothetical protein